VAKKSIFSARYQALKSHLIDARKDRGLTQAGLASKLGRPQSFVSKYERGERRLDLIEFLEVADVLGFDPVKFIQRL
jgi:transcriptional regulator with XRE-family HTH domain